MIEISKQARDAYDALEPRDRNEKFRVMLECLMLERERCAQVADKEANEWDMIDDDAAQAARNVAILIRGLK